MNNEWRVSRRSFLAAAVSVPLLAACGQAPAASAPSAAASAGSSGSAGWQAQWDSWIAGAKKEGKLVLASGPSPEARVKVPEAFKKAFGVDVDYLGGATSDLANRLRSEQAANQFTVDVAVAGADTAFLVLYGEHLSEPIKPHLINPEAIDPKGWINGKVWYMDPEQQYIVRASSYLSRPLSFNTDQVKSGEIQAWHDLLKPQYKGKIATYDPVKNGSGGQTSAYLYNVLGADYVKSLYVDQNVAITGDYRQLSDWLARSQYPIALAMRGEDIDKLLQDKFKVEAVSGLSDASGYVSAGFGLLNLLKNPPHPNAAKLFLNWILMKDGQTAWNSSQNTVSIRTDVENTWAPASIVPKAGVDYFDTYSADYSGTGYAKANKAVKALLGQ
jgi:iron(III) transport system substrate-binding protein